MNSKHSVNINPLKAAEDDERQSLRGGLFANEEESRRQDEEKMKRAHAGYGQKIDGKVPCEPKSSEGLDPDEEMEQKG